ncbi:unnamed protein product [Clonostachys rosea f. rosea IK726]|uniref:Uncharacterized protein n=1 Tax=Clonostachys rosea f. rosea IK726 TaxID=1349383 RepID=A0ACA9U636_BIOOC|nr:unnamed protein product [Clonostachys rosea f. rosea IK726]
MQRAEPSHPATANAGHGYFGLGTMVHDTINSSRRDFEMWGWDPEFSFQDVHDIVEDFYGPSEKKDPATDHNGDQPEKKNPTNEQDGSMSKVSAEDDFMNWWNYNDDESDKTITCLGPTLASPGSQVVHDSPPMFAQDVMAVDSEDKSGNGNLQMPPVLLNSGEFEHSHLYNQTSRDLPLGSAEFELSRLYNRSPSQAPSPDATNMNQAEPHGHEQQGSQEGSWADNLNTAFPGLHLGPPQEYFHLIPELDVVLCTVCHVACPNTHRHIEQHLLNCHALPHVRHILTACLGLFPDNLPEDYSVAAMMDRIRDKLKSEPTEISPVPFLEASEAYVCPRDHCNYVDHDSRRVLMHCRNTHSLKGSVRYMSRVQAYSLHVSRINKVSVRARE